MEMLSGGTEALDLVSTAVCMCEDGVQQLSVRVLQVSSQHVSSNKVTSPLLPVFARALPGP